MKYRNRKTIVDNISFDSKKEATRYKELKLMETLGYIKDLKLQSTFELIPVQRGEDGKIIERACKYKADFTYVENGELVVEDTKGMRTKDYIIKRKLMLYMYGIKIKEV